MDEFTASFAATLFKKHPDYLILASNVAIDNHHKNTNCDFCQVMKTLNSCDVVSDKIINIITGHEDEINNMIDYSLDYLISYFGFKTLYNAYLLKRYDVVLERPQHMFMRVALSIHGDDFEKVKLSENFSISIICLNTS